MYDHQKHAIILFVVILLSSFSTTYANETTEQQARLMARRAAMADAQRQLLEIVKGVHIDSETTVRDFITEKDEIRTQVIGVLKGAEATDTRYLSDGSCEVDMEIDARKLQPWLGKGFRYPNNIIRATGAGVAAPPERVQVTGAGIAPPVIEDEPVRWYDRTIRATGAGAQPEQYEGTAQGWRMAERAALVDAQRNLLETVLGVRIDSRTTVRDFVTESDVIRSEVHGYLRGATVEDTRRMSDGSVEVDLALNIRGLRVILPDNPRKGVAVVPDETIEPVDDSIPNPQSRLMARRAAMADAQRQLLEIIEGVYIDSHTTVRDFMTQNDEIISRVDGVLRGAEVEDTRYLTDGSCEVDMAVDVRRLQRAIGRDFSYHHRTIRATGVGVVPETTEVAVAPIFVEEPDHWYDRTVRATGAGAPDVDNVNETQDMLMAERAAILDAQRNLLEIVLGVEIDSQTTVRDFVTESDLIRTSVQGFLRGAYVTDRRILEDGSVEVDMEINLRGLRAILPAKPSDDADIFVDEEPADDWPFNEMQPRRTDHRREREIRREIKDLKKELQEDAKETRKQIKELEKELREDAKESRKKNHGKN